MNNVIITGTAELKVENAKGEGEQAKNSRGSGI